MDDVPDDEVFNLFVFDQLCVDKCFGFFLFERWKEILKWSARDDVKAGQEGEILIQMNIGTLELDIVI